MIAIDTNILARVFVSDDDRQSATARQLVHNNDCFVSTSVVLEVYWVLAYTYKFSREDLAEALKDILETASLIVENSFIVEQALLFYHQGLDFADAIHLISASNCNKLYTFDKKFSKVSLKLQTNTQVELL